MEEEGTCQDMERNRLGEKRSHSGDGRGRDVSGHGWKVTEREALTNWNGRGTCQDTEGKQPSKGTHKLEMEEEETCQDTGGKRPRKRHSLPGDGRGRNLLGDGKEVIEREVLTPWRCGGETNLSGHGKKTS